MAVPPSLRRLGSGGPSVSPLGLGLAALGRPGYINLGHAGDLEADYRVEAMRERAWRTLDAAWAAGARYFDAARSYGLAEDFLGSWLTARGIGRDQAAVGSKWGYVYTAGWRTEAAVHEAKDHSAETFARQYAETKAALGGRLALYQIHSATIDSGALDRPEVLRAMARLCEDGVTPGLSLSGPAQADTLRRALEARVDGQPVFGCVQATWNLLEPSAGAALAEARAAGWGVIVKEALANGRLTSRNRAPPDAPLVQALERAAVERGVGPDAIALAAALAQPWAGVVLSGAASPEHVHANFAALAVEWDANLEAELLAFAEPARLYWEKRAALGWN